MRELRLMQNLLK